MDSFIFLLTLHLQAGSHIEHDVDPHTTPNAGKEALSYESSVQRAKRTKGTEERKNIRHLIPIEN